MTDAIEAGARAKAIVTDEMVRVACAAYRDYSGDGRSPTLIEMRVAIEAAIASGALVPASAVAEMRERCAKVADDSEQQSRKQIDHNNEYYRRSGTRDTGANQACDLSAGTSKIIAAAIRQLDTAPASGDYVVGWRDTSTARKDRTPILAKFFDDIYPRIEPRRPDLESWNGLQVVIRHPGIPDSGFDMGWSVAAPVGNGGLPDKWIEGWKPIHAASTNGDHLPDWDDVRGMAPDATGDLSSEAFVRKLRDEWDDDHAASSNGGGE